MESRRNPRSFPISCRCPTHGFGGRIVPGLIIYRFDSSLLFFNADYFKDRVRAVINDTNTKTKWVLFNAESVPLLDVTRADALEELRSELAGREIVLAVARGKGLFRVMLERTGVAGRIGAERLFPTVRAGAEAFLERAPQKAARSKKQKQ